MLEPLAVEFEQLGQVRQRAGTRATYTAPSNMYRSEDQVWFTLVGSSEAIFPRLCEAMGRPEVASDPRFTSNPKRIRTSRRSTAPSSAGAPRWTSKLAERTLDRCGSPSARSTTSTTCWPTRTSRRAGPSSACPTRTWARCPRPAPCRASPGARCPIPRSGPAVGEHNAEVYAAVRALRERTQRPQGRGRDLGPEALNSP